MNLIEIKDLYENKENFIDKEIEVGGWVRSIRDSKTFGFIVLMMELALNHYRLFTAISLITLAKFLRQILVLH